MVLIIVFGKEKECTMLALGKLVVVRAFWGVAHAIIEDFWTIARMHS